MTALTSAIILSLWSMTILAFSAWSVGVGVSPSSVGHQVESHGDQQSYFGFGLVGVQLQTVGLHPVGDFSHAGILIRVLGVLSMRERRSCVAGVGEDVDVTTADDAG